MKIKILFIHHARGWGGAPINMINIINGLDASKFEAEVLLIQDSIVREKLEENNITCHLAESAFYKKYYSYYCHIEPHYTKWYQVFKQIRLTVIWLLSRYIFAKRELIKFDFDIIHLNSSVLTDWLAPCKEKSKVVIHIQEPVAVGLLRIRHRFFKFLIKKYTDQIIAISKDNAERLSMKEKTKIIYNFLQIPPAVPIAQIHESYSVLFVGGSDKIKGFYTVVDCLKFLKPGIKIQVAGYLDHYKPGKSLTGYIKYFAKIFLTLKKYLYIRKLEKAPNIEIMGLTSNISDLMVNCDLLISPFSKAHFSRPVIEAFAYKKPVIGSDVQGMDEIIDHEKNGLIVEKNNPKALAEAINLLFTDRDKGVKMGIAGFNKAVLLYSPKNIELIENVYRHLCTT